jgi:hypothetical protein
MQTLSIDVDPECDNCLDKKIHKPATTKSIHPEFYAWELCEECAEELNKLKPPYTADGLKPNEGKPLE